MILILEGLIICNRDLHELQSGTSLQMELDCFPE